MTDTAASGHYDRGRTPPAGSAEFMRRAYPPGTGARE